MKGIPLFIRWKKLNNERNSAKMKKFIHILFFIAIVLPGFTQAPAFFNYQAVVRDNQGQAIKNQLVNIKIRLLEESSSGIQVFTENHFVVSSSNGIVNLKIGDGQNQEGDLTTLDWGQKGYWLEVSMDENGGNDFVFMNTNQLVSVPYALHAMTAEQAENTDDADADPTNELQNLSLVNNQLSISKGNTIPFPVSLDDDPGNELQDLASFKEGTLVNINISGGQGTSFDVRDNDSDKSNELQQLELNGTKLGITQGNEVDISAISNSYWQPSTSWDPYGIFYWGDVYMDTVTVYYKLKVGNNNPYATEIYDRDFFMNDNVTSNFLNLRANGALFQTNNPMNYSFLNKDSLMFKKQYVGEIEPVSTGVNARGLLVRNHSTENRFLSTGIELEKETMLGTLSENALAFKENDGLGNYLTRLSLHRDSLDFFNDAFIRTIKMGNNPDKKYGMFELYDGAGSLNLQLGTNFYSDISQPPNTGGLQLFCEGSLTVQLESLSDGGFLKFGKRDGTDLSFIGADQNGSGSLYMNDLVGNRKITMGIDAGGQGLITNKGKINIADQNNTVALSLDDSGLNVFNTSMENIAGIGKATGNFGSAGIIFANDSNGYPNFIAGQNFVDNYHLGGFSGIYDNYGILRAGMKVTSSSLGNVFGNVYSLKNLSGGIRGSWQTNSTDDAGAFYLYGPNNSINIALSYSNNHKDRGGITIYDENGIAKAGMQIRDLSGDGEIFADVKYFRMDYPEIPDKEIWYASLEGPEAAAYVRGTGSLINGEAFIVFPEHFRMVANTETMTVILTPLYWDTYGVAVTEKSKFGIRVKELKGGNGNFSFDWEVKCVRNGHENFEVVRKKTDRRAPIPNQLDDHHSIQISDKFEIEKK